MRGMDLPGADYDWFAVNSTDPHTCQANCSADPTCKAWVYVGEGTPVEHDNDQEEISRDEKKFLAGSGFQQELSGRVIESDDFDYPVPRCCLKNRVPSPRPNPACTSGILGHHVHFHRQVMARGSDMMGQAAIV